MRRFYLEECQIGLFVGTQQLGIQDLSGMDGLSVEWRICRGRRQDNPDALRSFHYVSVGDDRAVRIDDDASANRMLPDDSRCLVMSMILQWPVATNHDLDYRGCNFGRNLFKRPVQISQYTG